MRKPVRDEFDFIAAVQRRAQSLRRPADLQQGIGDDAAVFRQRAGRDTVITADLLVEDIDFRRRSTPPDALGHKALAVSLSDIAAMGARPRYALLSVGVHCAIWRTRFLEDFYEGFFALAARTGVALIGGDVSRTPEHIVIDCIVLGEAKHKHMIQRAGARPGDQLFVTGALGGATAGLRELESRRGRRNASATARARRLSARERTALIARQQRPEPRLTWGALLGEQRLASAMIDLSDGLSSDLAHLCRASDAGALIEAASIPVDPNIAAAGFDNSAALDFALHGGEDFELLFAVSPRKAARLPRELDGAPVTRIGEVRPVAEGLKIRAHGRTRTLKPAGFQHF